MPHRLPLIQKLKALPMDSRVMLWTLSGLAVLSLTLTLYISQREYSAYIATKGERLLERAASTAANLREQAENLSRAATFLARTPPPKGIARAALNNGVDPEENTPLTLWRERLETIFGAFAASHPDYFQIRLIGVRNNGVELVRVESRNGVATATPAHRLQFKGDRDYYRSALALKEGEVYLSTIDLNHDHAAITTPEQRTLRALAPVYLDDKMFALIVINAEVGDFFDALKLASTDDTRAFVTDAAGNFLLHSDDDKSFDFARSQAPGEDATNNTAAITGLASPMKLRQHIAQVTGAAQVISKTFHYAKRSDNKPLTISYAISEKQAAREAWRNARPILGGVLLAVLVFALLLRLLLKRTFDPLRQLTQIAHHIGVGRYDLDLPTGGFGETATFIKAFQEMLERIRKRDTENSRLLTELQRSEVFSNSVVETTPESILVINPEGRMVRVNTKAEQLFGYSAEEMLGQHVEMLLPQGRQQSHVAMRRGYMKSAAQRVMGDGRSLSGQRKNGEEFPVEIDLGPLNIGEEQYVIACVLDVTQRKAAEESLRRSEERFRLMTTNMQDYAIFMLNPAGHVLTWNLGAENLKGYSESETLGQPMAMFFLEHELSEQLPEKLLTQARENGRAEHEGWRARKDGSRFYSHVVITALHDDSGLFIGYANITHNISERKAAEDRIAALNESLEHQVQERTSELCGALALQQAVFDNAGLSLITTDPQGIITTFNPAAEAMLGYRAHEVVDKLPLTVVHLREELDEYAAKYPSDTVDDTGFNILIGNSGLAKADTKEWTYVRKDGTRLPVLLSMTALGDADTRIYGYLGIAADLTGRKKEEEQLRLAISAAEAANRAKSDFLANMSHEIRTPMNGVIGLSKLLRDTALDHQQRQLLDKLIVSSNALLSILNDILDYSKIEAGKMVLEQVEFQVEEILETSATLFAQGAEEKDIEVLLRIAPDVPQTLLGDPLRLSQIINNLLGNAIKFTEVGHIHVGVSVCPDTPESDDTTRLLFEINDTGIGMTKEQTAQLFQAFHQADSSVTRKYGGTGLGLSISQRLVELMQGEIGVDSTHDKGSRFWFTAPLSKVKNPSQALRPLGQLRGMRVLGIDDQRASLEILSEILHTWDFDVELADSAERGIEKTLQAEQQGRPFEAFLIDWKMPDIDGLQMAQKIEDLVEQGKITRAPVVVMVTAYGHDQVLEAAGSLQLSAVLDKPVTSSRLFDILVDIQSGQRRRHKTLQADQVDEVWRIAQPIHGAHVLLVEDNATNQFIASQFLGKMALHVDTANHGGEAVQMVAERDYDAVLMDLQMPTMSGLEATRLIRKTDKGFSLPIIAMTAAAMLEDRAATEAAGMNAHIAKPVNPEELASTLVDWIPARNARLSDGMQLSTSNRLGDTDENAAGTFEVPGLNLEAAVERLNNNWSGLRKVLKVFNRDFGDAVEKLNEDLQADRIEEALRLAHTIKGLAQSIGAEPLEASAKRFEQDLQEGRTDTQAEFERDLEFALHAISQLEDAPQAISDILPQQEMLGIRELTELLRELASMVKESLIVPRDVKDSVRQGLLGHVEQPTIQQLLEDIERLDYVAADEDLKLIAGQFGIDLAS